MLFFFNQEQHKTEKGQFLTYAGPNRDFICHKCGFIMWSLHTF